MNVRIAQDVILTDEAPISQDGLPTMLIEAETLRPNSLVDAAWVTFAAAANTKNKSIKAACRKFNDVWPEGPQIS